MFYRTEAQRVATALFMSVREGNIFMNTSPLTEEEIHDKLTPRFGHMKRNIEAHQAVPYEFRLIDLSEYQSGDVRDMLKIESALGKCATTGTANSALRIVRTAQAA